jgi:hypothetical protein
MKKSAARFLSGQPAFKPQAARCLNDPKWTGLNQQPQGENEKHN